ncbi:MAG: hypothetical protein RLZZ227_1191 [Pseudomonadota bacterium]|jgi:heptosyltransferase-3
MISAVPEASTARRVILLNPTKYLGNLLIAGGLIQQFAAWCKRQDREFLLVLDAAFQDLCVDAFPGVSVFYYPRQQIRRSTPWQKVALFAGFVRRLRRFKADLAFTIEDDSLTTRLTQLSGAAFRVGCSPQRQGFGFELVLPITYGHRPSAASHRWYSYQEVFVALGLPAEPGGRYINLHIDQPDASLIAKLAKLGRQSEFPLVAIHASATKDYKKWPENAFIHLCNILKYNNFQPALIGAGQDDLKGCARMLASLTKDPHGPAPLNLCNQLTLRELAGCFRQCTGIVGNDSGPSHLASAQQVPGVVVFGPSDPRIWGPLGSTTRVLRKAELCDPQCSRRACHAEYRCLQQIAPDEVFAALTAQIDSIRT